MYEIYKNIYDTGFPEWLPKTRGTDLFKHTFYILILLSLITSKGMKRRIGKEERKF